MKAALFQMFPIKTPGPDGFPAHFATLGVLWREFCGDEVTEVVLRLLQEEDDPSAINNTCIVLIPKVEQPEELGQFRPISLCNVIYKIEAYTTRNYSCGAICLCAGSLDHG